MSERISTTQKLHDRLGDVIAASKPGERLPSEPYLARQLGVSRATLREAMRTFETQGLIRRQQGVGTFVLRPAHVLETGLEVLESIESIARRIGLTVSVGKLKIDRRKPTPEEVEALCQDANCRVIALSRVIQAEERPVAYLIDCLPEDILSPEEVRENFSGSVLDLLLQRGSPALANSRCEIAAEAARPEIARALNIQRGDALLRFTSRLFSMDGRVVDYSYSYFLPGYFRFHVIRELTAIRA
jgi:GntR family transcriptional regulator